MHEKTNEFTNVILSRSVHVPGRHISDMPSGYDHWDKILLWTLYVSWLMRRSCWMTSKGPFQLELFYEYWYQVTFVKCPRSLELQKEQTWGQKCNPKSTLQGVLVEMTGKFNVFRFLGRSKSICFACPGKLEHNRMGYCQWAPRERERWPAEIFH